MLSRHLCMSFCVLFCDLFKIFFCADISLEAYKLINMFKEFITGVVVCLYIWICPYTKVEESFNLQAMHDLIYLKANLSDYDHLEFPGVVPRSFLGGIVVSTMSTPIKLLLDFYEVTNKFWMQLAVRACLGLLVLHGYTRFVQAVQRKIGPSVARWLVAITLTQFHFLFYASRPLPNTFALAIVLHALSDWLRGRHAAFIWTSASAIIIFRAELCILCGILLLIELVTRRLSVLNLLKHAIPAGALMLGLTILVDSVFWGRWLWPEGEVLWFNTFLNKSSQWGTSPFLWYFYSVLPRALGCSIVLVPLGLYFNSALRPLVAAALCFVCLYSVLPHKELRFIVYVFPILNMAAAAACSRLWQTRHKSRLRSLMAFATVVHLTLNCVLSLSLLYISSQNYPGGAALQRLHNIEASQSGVNVHIDVYSAQTGISRFTQIRNDWIYDKTENLTAGSAEMLRYTHLLVEATSGVLDPDSDPALKAYATTHSVLDVIHAFHRINVNQRQFPPVTLQTAPKIYILKKLT